MVYECVPTEAEWGQQFWNTCSKALIASVWTLPLTSRPIAPTTLCRAHESAVLALKMEPRAR